MKSLLAVKLFFKEIYLRFTLASPDFLVKFRKLCLTIATICTTLSASGVEFEIYGVSVTKLGAITSAVAAIVASLGVKDPVELQEKLEA